MSENVLLSEKVKLIENIVNNFDFASDGWTMTQLQNILAEHISEKPGISFTWPRTLTEGQNKNKPKSVTIYFTDGDNKPSKIEIII